MEQVVSRSGLEKMLQKDDEKEKERLGNVNELISAATEYDKEHPEGTLADYLAEVSLVSDADHMEGNGGAVTLMTLHAAKGLEFPVVAMIGMEEGCLPHARVKDNPEDLEEERRLCFVGITRAQERLILSCAGSRMIRGRTEYPPSSQFLIQMPQEKLSVTDCREQEYDTRASRYGRSWDEPGNRYHIGQRVRHRVYGAGTILDISGTGQRARAVIEFASVGRRNFVLETAELD